MKTCKDCIYYDQTGPTCGQCCLNPKAIEIDDDRYHWCGQLKEKADNADGDFSLDSYNGVVQVTSNTDNSYELVRPIMELLEEDWRLTKPTPRSHPEDIQVWIDLIYSLDEFAKATGDELSEIIRAKPPKDKP